MKILEIIQNKTQINYKLLRDKKIRFQKNYNKKHIFHYTSIGGLEGILRNKTLRFTNIKYMNDKDETIAGLDSLSKICNVSENEREALISAFKNHGLQTFVCCFSLEEDSLPMWNYYTKEINNQGYNIEFDDKMLVESILKTNPILDGCEFAFGIVDYSRDNESEYSKTIKDEIITSMDFWISKLFLEMAKNAILKNPSNINKSVLKELEEKAESSKGKKQLSDLPIFFYNGERCSFEKNIDENYLCFIKRDYFKQEREFRIVITVPDELLPSLKKSGAYKFRISNGILVPYLELKFSPDVIKSLTISPTVRSDLVEQSITDFLTYCNFSVDDYSKFIKHSNIPVRF